MYFSLSNIPYHVLIRCIVYRCPPRPPLKCKLTDVFQVPRTVSDVWQGLSKYVFD